MNRRLLALATLLALGFGPIAYAQDSATVDVTATIVAPSAELSVAGIAELEFGTVTLPGDGAQSCTYSVFPGGGTFISANGDKTACRFSDTAQAAGVIEIACAPEAPLNLSLSFESTITAGNPGVTFQTTEFDTQLDGGSYDTQSSCDADGTSTLTIGGALQITSEAQQTFEPVRVGTVTLEASY